MNTEEILATLLIGLMVTAVSVIAHMWVAYTRAPKLAVRGVKAWLEGEEGIKSLQNWFSRALSLKDKESGLTVTQILARDAVGGLVSFVGSTDGKKLLEESGKSLIKQARSYLESEDAIEALEAIGSRTVDAAVGYLETDEGKAVIQKLMTPVLAQGATIAADGVKEVIGSYLGNVSKGLQGAVGDAIAGNNPIISMLAESPGGKKVVKKYGPILQELFKARAGGAPSGSSSSPGGWA